MTWYPTGDDVLALHFQLVRLFARDPNPISPPGARDMGLVESACGRPRTALGGTEKYRTVEQKGAALFHSLVKNHPFHNGNKRTALITLVTFLWRNDRRVVTEVSDDEVFGMVVGIANNEFPDSNRRRSADEVVEELSSWLRERTASLEAKSGGMTTRAFLKKCEEAGLSWKLAGTSYVVWKDQKHSLRFSRSTNRLDGPVVRQYLKELGLTDVRVDEFQEGLNPEAAYVRRFRNVLRRLAHA